MIGVPGLNYVMNHIFIAEGRRFVYPNPNPNSVICHESYIYHIFIAGGERLEFRDSTQP